MTITQNDLEILKTEVMADTPDGGGLPTAEPIADGVSNNLFPDVSDIDALTGRVRLRKIALAVKTAAAETLQAARFLFTEIPDNENMSVFAFKATSFADHRSDAKNRIESYLTPATRVSGHILETQLEGQRVIQLSLDLNDDVPKVSKPLVLVQNEGQSDEFYQYIKPLKVDAVTRRFQKSASESVSRKVVTIEFTESLKRTFNGLTVAEFYQNASTSRRAVLRTAQVSNAAKYYSASRLAEPVTALASRQVKLESIYTRIVPSATTETALPLLDPVGQSQALVKSSDGRVEINKSISVSPDTPWQIGSSVYPSSMELTINGIVMTDSDGELRDSSGVIYASVDYNAGRVVWYNTANFGIKPVVGSFAPASPLLRVMQTELIYTPETDVGTSYLRTLQAKPLRGTIRVSFQVSGQVSEIRDDAKGNLINSSGDSYGIIDYENSLVQLVLPAIPDAESAIIFTYSTDLGSQSVGGQTIKGGFDFDVAGYVPPNSTITWGSKSATISGNIISGDATGSFDGYTLHITPNELPSVGTVFTITYQKPTSSSQTKQGGETVGATSNGRFSFNVDAVDANKFTGSFEISAGDWSAASGTVKLPNWRFAIKDDGNGNIVRYADYGASTIIKPTRNLAFDISGTINYATGAVTINFDADADFVDVVAKVSNDPRYKYFKYIDAKIVTYEEKLTPATAQATEIMVQYRTVKGLTGTETKTIAWAAESLSLNLPKTTDAPVVKGSVSVLGANDSNGLMVKDGLTIGDIDYSTGHIELNNWSAASNNITVSSALLEFAVPTLSSVVFRTVSAPIKMNTFSISLKADDKTYQLTADTDGKIGQDEAYSGLPSEGGILTSGVTGFIDYQTGVVAIYANEIDPSSVSYSAVSYSQLPLDAELIGLDPVRLPTDGRVQFVQAGDSIAITELKSMQLPTHQSNDSFDLGFERLSDVTIVDSEGVKVDYDKLNIDLDAGIVTLDSSFSAATYSPPFTAKYRIMDLAQVVDTDISGRVTLSTPITHNYSTAAVFSTMLLAGDMQSRVTNEISQKSWNGVWSDQLIGLRSESQLKTTNNPIVVTNADAITERWALIFTSATAFRIVGETVGEIATGLTSGVTAPLNPVTQQPYFTVPVEAWGTGWDAGNVVRFNTIAAAYPLWIGNAIQQHQLSRLDTYDFTIGFHANIDRVRGE